MGLRMPGGFQVSEFDLADLTAVLSSRGRRKQGDGHLVPNDQGGRDDASVGMNRATGTSARKTPLYLQESTLRRD